MNIITALSAIFIKVKKLGTYQAVAEFLLNLVSQNVPTRILNIYKLFIQAYELLRSSIKKLVLKVAETPNGVDNYCAIQALKILKVFRDRIDSDLTEAMEILNIKDLEG